MGAEHDLTGCRVLVVEDEFFIAADVTDALAALGATVIGPFPRCDEAMAALVREAPGFAVLDVNLQGTMVHALADALVARGVPFVFATGYDAAAMPARFRDVPRWEKPFDPTALAAALPALVRGG